LVIFVIVIVSVISYYFTCYLKNNSNESFRNSARSNKVDNSKKHVVIVTFTTLPSRIDAVYGIIQDIKNNQTVQPDFIIPSIPFISKRKGEVYTLPSNLNNYISSDSVQSDPQVIINRCDDMGPITKLMGVIPLIKSSFGTKYNLNDPNTIIITIDDDQFYSKYLIEDLIIQAEKDENAAVCQRGFFEGGIRIQPMACLFNNTVSSPKLFIQGYGGVLYRRKFITEDMVNYVNEMASSKDAGNDSRFLSDDLVISMWLQRNNITKTTLCDLTTSISMDNTNIGNLDGLKNLSRGSTYSDCIKKLKNDLF